MESSHNKKFDQQVRKKFEDFSVEAPSAMWAAIEKEMEHVRVEDVKVFRLKRYRYIGAIAAMLVIGFTIWQIQPEEKIYLRGEDSVERTALVQKPDVKELSDNREPGLVQKEDKEPVFEDFSRVETTQPLNEDVSLMDGHSDIHQVASRGSIVEQKAMDVLPNESHIPINPVEEPIPSRMETQVETLPIASSLIAVNEERDSLDNIQSVVKTQPEERQKIVTGILNFVAANLQLGGDRRVEFTENEHGIIKIGLKQFFAKNDQ